MSVKVLDRLKERFGDAVLSTHSKLGDDTAVVPRERIVEVMQFLRDDPECQLNYPSSVTGVDYLGREPRFEVVYHLYSTIKKHRVRIKCGVPEEDPNIPSVVAIYSGLDWFERETWDMFGITFTGHPDFQSHPHMRRIFMYESFEGHPLRKDYPKEKRQPLVRREGNH